MGLAEPFPVARLRRSVVAELCLALAILAVTALLVTRSRPDRATPRSPTRSRPWGSRSIRSCRPPGSDPSTRSTSTSSVSAGTPRAVPELDVSISLPSESIGPLVVPLVISGPGHYYAANFDIPVAGTWIIKYTVRTDAIDEQVVTADLPVH